MLLALTDLYNRPLIIRLVTEVGSIVFEMLLLPIVVSVRLLKESEMVMHFYDQRQIGVYVC